MNSYKSVAYIVASASLVLCSQASAWVPYNEFLTQDQYDNLQSPPIEENLDIAGLKLTIDRTQLGWSLHTSGKESLVGEMDGSDYSVKIIRFPSSSLSLPQIAARMQSDGNVTLSTNPIHAQHGLNGLKTVYGQKSHLFGIDALEIRYFFVNLAGETICFDATSKSQHPDWSYFNYLMSHAIEPSRS